MGVNQTQVMQTLSYLRGERTIPTTNVEGRKDFIQRTLEEVYAAFPWKCTELESNLSVVSGIATLPSGVSLDHEIYASVLDGSTEIEHAQIDSKDRHKASAGDNVWWLSHIADGRLQLNTKEAIDSVIVRAHSVAPEINASVSTPFNDRMTLALGANRFVKVSEDPDADISQDEALFVNRLNGNISNEQRSEATQDIETLQTLTGHYTGEI